MENLYYVYILKSEKTGVLYVGIAMDVEARLIEHNKGKSKFTSGHIPWSLIYKEFVGTGAEARIKEKYYKSTAGKNYLRKNGMID